LQSEIEKAVADELAKKVAYDKAKVTRMGLSYYSTKGV